MAAKRKQDDKHLKLLRELGAKPDNKKCFDCEQRGPTYVNMTVGSFVCTRCSGILRGLNPPHRVKSISMTSFTTQEIEFLEKHGNEYCRQTWLGLENSRSSSLESKDEQKVRDYMVQKYERKRWYVPPGQAKLNSSSSNSTPEAQPLKKLVANESPKATTASATAPTNKAAAKISLPMPGAVPGPALQASAKPATAATTMATSGPPQLAETRQPSLDLLGDLGGDPFNIPQQLPQQQPAAAAAPPAAAGGFANFGQAFSSQPASQGTQPATFDPFGASPSFPAASNFNAFGPTPTPPSNAAGGAFGAVTTGAPPATSGFAAFGAAPAATPATAPGVNQTAQSLLSLSLSTSAASSSSNQPAAATSTSADKYAIFSSLATDSSSGGVGSSGGGGSAGTTINWSGGGGATSSASSIGGTGIDWTGANKGPSTSSSSSMLSGGGIDWGPGSNTNIKQPSTSSGLGLMSGGMSSGQNPFGSQGSTAAGMGQASTQPVYTSSMGGFGAPSAPQTTGFGVFPSAQGMPGSSSAGLGTPASGSMMNGGYGQMQPQVQAGFGGMAPMGAGAAPAAAGQMGAGVNPAGGFGLQPQQQQQGFPGAISQPAAAGKAGFAAGQGFSGSAGFGMTAGFGQPQPQMGIVGGGPGFGAQATMGQGAAGSMGFGTQQQQQQQAMPATAGGWPQQQSNPFMGQTDGFGSHQPPAQRSTNPFM